MLEGEDWVDWSLLERDIPLFSLPAFHRNFLQLNRPELNSAEIPLRQVQQFVMQTLNNLLNSGAAKRIEGEIWVHKSTLPPR